MFRYESLRFLLLCSTMFFVFLLASQSISIANSTASGKPLSPEEEAKLRHPAKTHVLSAIKTKRGKYAELVDLGISEQQKNTSWFTFDRKTGEIIDQKKRKTVACLKILEKKGIITLREQKDTNHPHVLYHVQINDAYKRYYMSRGDYQGNGLLAGVSAPVEFPHWEKRNEQEVARGDNVLLVDVRYKLVDTESWYTNEIAALCPVGNTNLTLRVEYHKGQGWR